MQVKIYKILSINFLADFFFTSGILLLFTGYFIIIRHVSVFNIGLAVTAIGASLNFMIRGRKPKTAISTYVLFSFLCIFLIYFISYFITSENFYDTLSYSAFRIVILVSSLIFYIAPVYPEKYYRYLILAIALVQAIICVFTIHNFILVGKREGFTSKFFIIEYFYTEIIPQGVYHHTLGFFLLINIVLLQLYVVGNRTEHKFFQRTAIFFIVCFFITLLIIAAKLAIVLSLLSTTVLLYKKFYATIRKGPKLYGLTFLVMGILLGFSQFGPLKMRLQNALSDLKQVFDAKITPNEYRLHSYRVGLHLLQEYNFKGISESRADEIYKEFCASKYPQFAEIRPHNQLLNDAVIMGLFLALSLQAALFIPWLYLRKYIIINIFYTALLGYTLVDSPLNIREFYYFFGIILPFIAHVESSKALHAAGQAPETGCLT